MKMEPAFVAADAVIAICHTFPSRKVSKFAAGLSTARTSPFISSYQNCSEYSPPFRESYFLRILFFIRQV